MTGAPLVANGVVIVGVAGAESALAAISRATTRRREIACGGFTPCRARASGRRNLAEPGGECGRGKHLDDGSYDPISISFTGHGQPLAHNALDRKGDNLYTDSILAIRPRAAKWSGIIKTSPNDPFD